jgi:hypothetical protein
MRRPGPFADKAFTQEIVLPGITRIYFLHYLYIRWGVPVDESSVRNFYWHIFKGSPGAKLWARLRYHVFHRWAMNTRFSDQDRRVVGAQNYSAPERLSWTDAVVVGWRKMVLQGYHAERLKRTRQRS